MIALFAIGRFFKGAFNAAANLAGGRLRLLIAIGALLAFGALMHLQFERGAAEQKRRMLEDVRRVENAEIRNIRKELDSQLGALRDELEIANGALEQLRKEYQRESDRNAQLMRNLQRNENEAINEIHDIPDTQLRPAIRDQLGRLRSGQ